MAFFDYSKVFDTVWREKLLLKMRENGIPGTFIRWTADFLDNRRARVLYQTTLSNTRRFRQGTPQGSVLSPLLFLLFIDDVTNRLPPECALFMDDLSVWSSNSDRNIAAAEVQNAVNEVDSWSSENKFQLNVQKCEVSYFG